MQLMKIMGTPPCCVQPRPAAYEVWCRDGLWYMTVSHVNETDDGLARKRNTAARKCLVLYCHQCRYAKENRLEGTQCHNGLTNFAVPMADGQPKFLCGGCARRNCI